MTFGEQPSSAKWNQLGENDASFADGTGIDDGAITPDKLTLGSQVTESGSLSTSSTSYTDFTGGTLTLDIISGGAVFVSVSGYAFTSSANEYCYTQLNITGANTDTYQFPITRQPSTSNQRLPMGGTHILTGLAAGSTTFKLQGKVTSGTGTFTLYSFCIIPLGL